MKSARVVLASLVAALAFTGAASAGGRFDDTVVAVRDYGGGWRDRDRGDRFSDVMPERRIVRRLMRQGFVEIRDIDLRRDRYIVRAIRPNGAVIRLAVDAYDGEILSRERIGWAGDRGPRGPRPGWDGPRHGGDGPRAGWDGPRRDRDRPDGIEFDFGGGSFGLYTR